MHKRNVDYRGRLNHGRHFTFKSVHGDVAITLVSEGVEGTFVSESSPLVAHGHWLQIFISKLKCEKILRDFEEVLHKAVSPVEVLLKF